MSTLAIIDLGSNTFNLLIIKRFGQTYQTIFKTRIPTKIGAEGFDSKTITPEAFKRGLVAIQALHMIITEYRSNHIYAFATSAMRDATNGSTFVKEVRALTGIEIKVISGDREAELIYNGVSRALQFGSKPELIMDIGGGSTEFVIASEDGVLWKHSFDLGVTRLLEQLNPSNPLSESDIEHFNAFLNDHLSLLFKATKDHDITGLIGSSGSFESLAEMIEVSTEGSPKLSGATEYDFNLNDLSGLNTILVKSTISEREQMMGLVPYRLETIHLASMFIQYIIQKLSLPKVRLSTYALREGVVSELSENF